MLKACPVCAEEVCDLSLPVIDYTLGGDITIEGMALVRCSRCKCWYNRTVDVDTYQQEILAGAGWVDPRKFDYWIEERKALFDYIVEHFVVRQACDCWIDVGPGTGELMKLIAADGFHVHGVEVVPAARQYLRDQGFSVSTDLDEVDGSECVRIGVVAIDSIYYMPDPRAFIHAIAANEKIGYLLIRSINRGWMLGLLASNPIGRRLFQRRYRLIHFGRAIFSSPPGALCAVLEEAGFEVRKIRDPGLNRSGWKWRLFGMAARVASVVGIDLDIGYFLEARRRTEVPSVLR